MKIIFLDIDGPVIPGTHYLLNRLCSFQRDMPAHTVAVLREMVARTGAKIVVNSTHNRPFDGVANIIPCLIDAGIDADHFHPQAPSTDYPGMARDLAIKKWLAENPGVEDWVAVDDVVCADDDHMVLVDFDSGLTLTHLNIVAERFGGKPFIVI